MTPDHPIDVPHPPGSPPTSGRFEPYRLRRGVLHVAQVRGPFTMTHRGGTIERHDAARYYLLETGTGRPVVVDQELGDLLMLLLERAGPLPTDPESLAQLLAERSRLPAYAGERWRLLLTDPAGVKHAAAAAHEHGFYEASVTADRLLAAAGRRGGDGT